MKASLRLFSTAVMVGGVAFTSIADNKEGVEFYKSNQPGIAKQIFLENLNANTNDAEAFYYLGEILFSEQKLDSAALFFDKGLSADPESALNKIGKAKLLIKSNPAGAEEAFKEILSKKNKKNVTLLLAVAKAYFDNGKEEYKKYIDDAKNADRKNPEIYLLEGDILMTQKKYGEAAARYEQSIYFDSACKEAYLKYAQLYSEQNQDLAINMLNKLLELDANSALALRELGEIYFKTGKFANAAEVYEKYMTLEHNNTRDLIRYALILYYSKDYQKSLDVINTALAKEPGNVALNRLAMYNLFEMKKFDESLTVAQKLMSLEDKSVLLANDYAYFGRLLNNKKEYEQAAAQFEKSYELDSTKVDLMKELSTVYGRLGNHDKSIGFLNKFIQKGGDAVKTQDYFSLGRAYLMAGFGTTDSIQRRNYLIPADSAFAKITEGVPDNFLGYLWRAKANAGLDTGEIPVGLAKPYYEKALELLLADPQGREKELMECYTYLGVYYLKHDDTAKTREYFEKVLAIDPNDAMAKQVIDALNNNK